MSMMNGTGRIRVVVTGMGAVTPLGTSVAQFWDGLVAGRSGVRRITQFDASGFDCQVAGEVPDFDPADYLDSKEVRRMSRTSHLAIAAAREAATQAGLDRDRLDGERMGVLVGSAIGGLEKSDEAIGDFRSRGSVRAKPFSVTASIPNMPAHYISREFQTFGPLACITTACATGTQTVAEAAEYIRRGVVDVMFAGGAEATIRDFAIAGFSGMKALPTHFNDRPAEASRPFDVNREGFVYSEGAGILVLESLEHARRRGAQIIAEVLGGASSSDAFHVAAPDPSGMGAIRAMRWALDSARVNPAQIGYINAHGSSTPLNDPLETQVIKEVFGERAYDIPVNSTKSMIGHPMGASGTLEAIVCIQTINTGVLHPTINLNEPDPACDLDYVPNVAREAKVDVAMSNSFGLGGQNACVVVSRFDG